MWQSSYTCTKVDVHGAKMHVGWRPLAAISQPYNTCTSTAALGGKKRVWQRLEMATSNAYSTRTKTGVRGGTSSRPVRMRPAVATLRVYSICMLTDASSMRPHAQTLLLVVAWSVCSMRMSTGVRGTPRLVGWPSSTAILTVSNTLVIMAAPWRSSVRAFARSYRVRARWRMVVSNTDARFAYLSLHHDEEMAN